MGICFKDFAILATDKTNARSIMVMKEGTKPGPEFFFNFLVFLKQSVFVFQIMTSQLHCRRKF
jgi:hypothetical protein